MPITTTGGRTGGAYKKTPVNAANGAKAPLKEDTGGLSLPSQKSKPLENLGLAKILIHGEPGIGKTSLASRFPDALMVMFEPGDVGLELYPVHPKNWGEFKSYVKLLTTTKDGDRFKTVVWDTIGRAYTYASNYCCKRANVDHPSKGAYGAIWDDIRKEIDGQVELIAKSGRGQIFLAHTELTDVSSRGGATYQKMMAEMGKKARQVVVPLSDLIFYYGYYGDKRYLTVQGSSEVETKQRFKNHFRTTKGEKIHSIPMFNQNGSDFDEDQAYEKLLRAFRNEQTIVGKPVEVTGFTDKPVSKMQRGVRK